MKYLFNLTYSQLLAVLILIIIYSCRPNETKTAKLDAQDINKAITAMTEVMVHDITNPPLAARFFSYACLSGYEVVAQNDSTCRSFYGILNEYPKIDKPPIRGTYSMELSAILAILQTAQKMQPSGKLLADYEQKLIDSCQKLGFSPEIITHSKEYAAYVSEKIRAYAKTDHYNEISNYPRYTPSVGDGFWYPTPPAYIAAVEPYFNTVRPFTLKTAAQFKPKPPIPFSSDKRSDFYKLMQAVKEVQHTPEQNEIAAFWDCNPFAVQDNGHLQVALKKISPGAHWLGIAGIACKQSKTDFSKTLYIHSLVSIGLMDGFICCWDEKYRSNRIRPETAIRKYIDPTWQPFLQTPPFPEYLSGHSTISATSATILTHFFGDNFAYEDTIEEQYGLKARAFKSFKEAANEAGISRFYGGIHFMDAIDNGNRQGKMVGEWVLSKLIH